MRGNWAMYMRKRPVLGLIPYAIPGVTGLCIGITYWLFRLKWLVVLTTVIPTAVVWLQQLAAALIDRSFVPLRARDVIQLAEKEGLVPPGAPSHRRSVALTM